MLKLIKLFSLLLVIGMTGKVVNAQSAAAPAPLKHYKTDFVVKEVDATGRVVNSRSYSTILATNNQGSPDQIRSGNRVPIQTDADEKGSTKYQYIDIGINIDCHNVHDVDEKLAMSVKAEISKRSRRRKLESRARSSHSSVPVEFRCDRRTRRPDNHIFFGRRRQ